MTLGISLEELLAWNNESAEQWKALFDANPALLKLPCGINGAPDVQELVRHNWIAELRWAQQVAAIPVTPRSELPAGPLHALFALHRQAHGIFQRLLDDAAWDWEHMVELPYEWLPPQIRTASRRKMAAQGLLHSQRHWAQLASHLRTAGFPCGFEGDLIFTRAIA